MRSDQNLFSPLFFILLAFLASRQVQSFLPRHRKFWSVKQRHGGSVEAEEDRNDRELIELALSSSRISSTSQELTHPWYSHPKIERDRSHVQKRYNNMSDILNHYREEQEGEQNCNTEVDNDNDVIKNSKFLLISSNGMWHRISCSSSSIAAPLYLTVGQLDQVINGLKTMDAPSNSNDHDENPIKERDEPIVAWVGKFEHENYWVISLNDDKVNDKNATNNSKPQLESILMHFHSDSSEEKNFFLDCKPLREFGDSLQASHDAGILATANGLIEFHKSHRYCSRCGGPTRATKAGGSRTCTLEGCLKSVYPRIDSATIMLVTSFCENYALLGRKRSWPPGRYSTLAGFCEVGETLEECCQRETYEESGVIIDPKSVQFAASQPWPFPRSLMVGFRAKAMPVSSLSAAALPDIVVDTNEMEDIQWFQKAFVKERLKLNGSTALTFKPNEEESKFHIPGKASLARRLITEWVDE